MQNMAEFAARLGCAAFMMTALPLHKASADPSAPDVAGISLGGSATATAAAIKELGEIKYDEFAGNLTLNGYKSDRLIFGGQVTIGHVIGGDQINLLYDMREPGTVIGIWRRQVFENGKRPLAGYIHDTLVQKFGQPLYDAALNKSDYEMLWNYGGQVAFGQKATGSSLRYSECTRINSNAEALSKGSYEITIDPIAARCGVWVRAFFRRPDANPDTVEALQLSAIDLPRIKASKDFISSEMMKGLANKQRNENGGASAVKPKL